MKKCLEGGKRYSHTTETAFLPFRPPFETKFVGPTQPAVRSWAHGQRLAHSPSLPPSFTFSRHFSVLSSIYKLQNSVPILPSSGIRPIPLCCFFFFIHWPWALFYEFRKDKASPTSFIPFWKESLFHHLFQHLILPFNFFGFFRPLFRGPHLLSPLTLSFFSLFGSFRNPNHLPPIILFYVNPTNDASFLISYIQQRNSKLSYKSGTAKIRGQRKTGKWGGAKT